MTRSGCILACLWLLVFCPSNVFCCLPVELPDPAVLALRIDKHIAARWKTEKIKPAVLADDFTFIRRVFLDLVGRIPTVSEVREFLDDKAPEKRRKWVARLISSPAHAAYWATFWRREWTPQINEFDDFEGWLTTQLRDGIPYNRIVYNLLTVSKVQTRSGTPNTFFAASDYKPDSLAANTTRAFLGINLDCAQCHDHPFARWTRDQFWETAAFFVRVQTDGSSSFRPVLAIPNTKKIVNPRLLTDPQPPWPRLINDDTGRTLLANWVIARDNPYFARNAVNRVWSNFFGSGLVEPLDDLSGENPASHPELLGELAGAFVESGFDLKYLCTAIALTEVYQLSSFSPGDPGPRTFAKAAVRGLTGEQLYDSIRVVAGLPMVRNDLESSNVVQERRRFAEKFGLDRAGTAQRSILQALALMNGKLTVDFTKGGGAPTLRAIANAPFLTTTDKIEAMYLASLGRKPAPEEWAPLVKYVTEYRNDGNPEKPYVDVFWALINSSEFNTNH